MAKAGCPGSNKSNHAISLANAIPDLSVAAVHTGSPAPGHSSLRSYPILSPPPEYDRATRPRLDQQPARTHARSRVGGLGRVVDSRYVAEL